MTTKMNYTPLIKEITHLKQIITSITATPMNKTVPQIVKFPSLPTKASARPPKISTNQPVEEVIISKKDKKHPILKELDLSF